MAWEENSRICLHMQLIAILSRTGVRFISSLSIDRLNKADDGCFVGIKIGPTRFAQTLSRPLCTITQRPGQVSSQA